MSGTYFVLGEQQPERRRRTLVKQDTHLSGCHCALGGVLEHRAGLLETDPGEQLHELADLHSVFEVLKQGGYWHSASAEHPSSADALAVLFHRRAG